MDEMIRFPEKQEHRVNVENVTLSMLTGGQSFAEGSPLQDDRRLHTHAHAELFACTESAIHLQTQHGMVALHVGDIAIVPPGLLHCKLPNPDRATWHVIDFLCTPRRRTGHADLMQRFSVFFRIERLLIVRDQPLFCAEIARISQSDKESGGVALALRFAALLAQLCALPMQEFGKEHATSQSLPFALSDKNKDIDRIARLDHLINIYFMSDLTLSRAAELLFISTRQLERIVQKEYGKPFRQLLCERRLTAAERMLSDATLSVGQIAATVGFSSRGAFARAFAQAYGATPTEYRKNSTR